MRAVELPVFNGTHLCSEERLPELVPSLFDSLLGRGAIALHNVGFDRAHMDHFYGAVDELFRCVDADPGALRWVRPDLSYERGYGPLWEETHKGAPIVDGRRVGNYSRFWHIGNYHAGKANVYPEGLSQEYINVLEEQRERIHRVFRWLMRATALYFGQPIDFFDPWTKEGQTILRLIHRPPVTDEAIMKAGGRQNVKSAHRHIDAGPWAVLPEARGEGLGVNLPKQEGEGREWVKVDVDPEAAIAYGGEMLTVLTGLPATSHESVIPEGSENASRRAGPGFGHLSDDAPLGEIISTLRPDQQLPRWLDESWKDSQQRSRTQRLYGDKRDWVVMQHYTF